MQKRNRVLFGVLAATGSAIYVIGTVRAQDADFKGFPDVPKTHWAFQAVTELAQKGILKGYPDEKRAGKLALTPSKPKSADQAAGTKSAANTRIR